MNNDQMRPGRFLRWHQARVLHAKIQAHLAKGGGVLVATHLKSWICRKPEQFQCRRDGVYMRRGRQWDCINHCAIRFY